MINMFIYVLLNCMPPIFSHQNNRLSEKVLLGTQNYVFDKTIITVSCYKSVLIRTYDLIYYVSL